MKLPKAKLENIVMQNVKQEILIYDFQTGKAMCLNETSAIVYQACNGRTTFDELKRKHRFTDDFIYFALDELKRWNLIEGESTNHFGGLSRRAVIRRVGLATMAVLPVITGLTAPKAAQAASSQSCLPQGAACDIANDQCCKEFCPFPPNQQFIGCRFIDNKCGVIATCSV